MYLKLKFQLGNFLFSSFVLSLGTQNVEGDITATSELLKGISERLTRD